MYIPEFVCGVVATILVEIVLIVIGSLIVSKEDDNKADYEGKEER